MRPDQNLKLGTGFASESALYTAVQSIIIRHHTSKAGRAADNSVFVPNGWPLRLRRNLMGMDFREAYENTKQSRSRDTNTTTPEIEE